MAVRYVLTFLCGYLLGFNTSSFFPASSDYFQKEGDFVHVDLTREEEQRNQQLSISSSARTEDDDKEDLPIASDNSKINEENKRLKEKVESLKMTLTQALDKSKKEKKLSKILEGSAKIERNNFLETFDFGTPNDGKSEVLLLYNDHEALPSNYKSLPLYFLSSMNATRASENCDYVHVVTIPRDDHRVW